MRRMAICFMASLFVMGSLTGIFIEQLQDANSEPTKSEIIYVGPGENHTDIQSAVDTSVDGDTIMIRAGTYSGDILLNKSINLERDPKGPVYIENCILNVTADNCRIENLILNGSENETFTGRIYVMDTVGVRITDCIFNGHTSGIHLENSRNCWIEDNSFLSPEDTSSHRMELHYSEHSVIINNDIYAETNHMVIHGSEANHIDHNLFRLIDSELNRANMLKLTDRTHNNVLLGNKFINNETQGPDTVAILITGGSYENTIGRSKIEDIDHYGILVEEESRNNWIMNTTLEDSRMLINDSRGTRLSNLTVSFNENVVSGKNSVITFRNSSGGLVENCTVKDSNFGLYFTDGSSSNLVRYSRIYNNRYGVTFINGSMKNTVNRCRIFDNYMCGILIKSADENIERSESRIQRTLVYDCFYFGIIMNRVKDVHISKCLIDNNTIGIDTVLSGNMLITYSRISNNYRGAVFRKSEYGNISNNEFHNNKREALDLKYENDRSTGFRILNNTFIYNNGTNDTYSGANVQVSMPSSGNNLLNGTTRGNYWSDLLSPDNDSDGIVDVPYVVNENSMDHHPITEKPETFDCPPIILTDNVEIAHKGIEYRVRYSALDLDTPSKDLKWYLRTNASWLKMSLDGVLNGTPDNQRDIFVYAEVMVTDGEHRDLTHFYIDLKVDFPENEHPPEIITSDLKVAYIGTVYSVQYRATDKDTPLRDLEWTFSTNSTWLDLTDSTLHGTPNSTDPSSCWVNITVSDGELYSFTNFTIHIKKENEAPVISTENNETCYEDIRYTVDYEAMDDDPLTWSLYTDAAFLSMDERYGILDGIPSNDDVGEWFVNVSVTDGYLSDSVNFTLEVLNVNDPPEITTLPVNNAYQDSTYALELKGHDIDPTNDTLNWSLRTNAGFLSINSSSRLLVGVPKNEDVGHWWVELTLSDGKGGFDVLNYTLTVNNVNDPPGTPSISISAGTLYENGNQTISASCFDADLVHGDQLNYTWYVKGIGIIGYGQVIDLSLGKGNYTLTLRVTDASGNYSELSMEISVLSPQGEDVDPHGDPGYDRWFLAAAGVMVVLMAVGLAFIMRKRRGAGGEEDDKIMDWDAPMAVSPLGAPTGPTHGLRAGYIGTKDMRPDIDLAPPETFPDEAFAMDEVLDDIDRDILRDEDREVVEEVMMEAVSFERPSSIRISRKEMESGLRRKHQKGEISRELYESLLEIVNRWEEE